MRFHSIDALRGIASLWVVLFHSYEGSHLALLAAALPDFVVNIVFRYGDAGVPIFFVISGFVIAHSIIRDNVDTAYFFKFTLKRSIRLDPPYWASIVLFVGLGVVSAYVKSEAIIIPDFKTIIAHLFYFQGILEIDHINIIYWTLCLEIQFYLVFCLVVFAYQRLGKHFDNSRLFVFFVVACISLLWPLGLVKSNVYPGLFFPHWHAFLCGVFAYLSFKGIIKDRYLYIYLGLIFVGVASSHSDFSLAAALTALFIHILVRFDQISSMNWKWLQFLGVISYSLYLTHNPVTGATFFILYKVMGVSLLSQTVAFFINLAVCIAFAYVFWLMFEKWSIQLSKRIKTHG